MSADHWPPRALAAVMDVLSQPSLGFTAEEQAVAVLERLAMRGFDVDARWKSCDGCRKQRKSA